MVEIIYAHRVFGLPAAAQDLAHQLVDALGRGYAQPLAHGMNVVQLGPEGDGVETGNLLNEEPALQSAVRRLELGLRAGEVAVDAKHQLAELGIAFVLPAGVRRSRNTWPRERCTPSAPGGAYTFI